MTIAFITNFINHHQAPVADAMYAAPGVDYTFIATEPMPESFAKNGYPDYDRPYLLRAYESPESEAKARRLAYEADVVIIGAAPHSYVEQRQKDNKVTFHYSERWLKNPGEILRHPWFYKMMFKDFFRFRRKRSYMLCSGSFVKKDYAAFGCFPGKFFKWGYFPAVPAPSEEEIRRKFAADGPIRLFWCARFIGVKRPRLAVDTLRRLVQKGYDVRLEMAGSGELLDDCRDFARSCGVADRVTFLGSIPSAEVLSRMRDSHIYLFTSTRAEGWGAVLNEAMGSGCAVVASATVGATAYLVEDDVNGKVFRHDSPDDLLRQVEVLVADRTLMADLAVNAARTIAGPWSPASAAESLVGLLRAAVDGRLASYSKSTGPASWA